MLRELDRWVPRTALREAVSCPPGPDDPVGSSINVADLASGDSEFVEKTAEIIADSGIDRHRIVLEVVETSLVDLPSRPLRTMPELAERGVRFAVDDFGTGYSSLAGSETCRHRSSRWIGGVVRGSADDSADLAVVRAVVDMANAMEGSCVAEGVETAEQLQILRNWESTAIRVGCFPRIGSGGAAKSDHIR